MTESPKTVLILLSNITQRDPLQKFAIKGIFVLEIFWYLIPVKINVYTVYISARTFNDYKGIMTTPHRFKCVATFHGSLSIHIFMLLIRIDPDSFMVLSDFTPEFKPLNRNQPFEPLMKCEFFFVSHPRTKNSLISKHCPLHSWTIQQGTANFEGIWHNFLIVPAPLQRKKFNSQSMPVVLSF